MAKPAQASGTVSSGSLASAASCINYPISSNATMAAFLACTAAAAGGVSAALNGGENCCIYAIIGYAPGQCTNGGCIWGYAITYTTGCPANSKVTGTNTCTCNDPYVPDSTQTSCVLPVCPANMSGIPCACNTDFVPDPNGPGCVYQTLTLTIESAYSTQGPFTTEPISVLALMAVVKDQFGLPKAGKQVTLTVDVQGGSGGHDHNENRPKGDVGCAQLFSGCVLGATDSNGVAGFTFRAPAPAGEHTITATCPGCNTANATVKVMVDGLQPIPGSQYYSLQDSGGSVIGAIRGKHSDNHYLTGDAIVKLTKFAKAYQTTVNPGAKLYFNDASLVWGGLFDVGSTTWTSPHVGHNWGRSIDIRAVNSGSNNEGAVPSVYFNDALKAAADAHAKAALHCTGSSGLVIGPPCNGIPNNRHFHVDF